MHINGIISFNNGWQILQTEKSEALADIQDAIGSITIETLRDDAEHRPRLFNDDRQSAPRISLLSFHRSWERLMRRQEWGSYRARSESGRGINLYIRSLKDGVSTKMLAADRMMLFPNWVLVEVPKINQTGICDVAVLLVPHETILNGYFIEENRFRDPGLFFERCDGQIRDLMPIKHYAPFVVIGFSEINKEISLWEVPITQDDNYLHENTIERALEFPKEYYQAGISILSYFGDVLKQKYPGIQAKIRIEQDGNLVRLHIQAEDGSKEIIEKTLEEYAMVVTDKASPEILFEDKLQIMALNNKLEIAKMEVRQTRDLLMITENNYSGRVRTLEEEIGYLREQVGSQMMLVHGSHKIIEKQIEKEERILITQIETSNKLVKDLIDEAGSSRDLVLALTTINEKLVNGVAAQDEETVKNAIVAVRENSADIFNELENALKNTMYGVSGNCVYQWLIQISSCF
jgi:hypothetical protein